MRHVLRKSTPSRLAAARRRGSPASLFVVPSAILILGAPATLYAEDLATSADTDIVVTATRRETKLQQTPVAVNALNANQLQQDRDFRSLNDLAGLAAGVHAPTSSTASTEPFFIRGIGTSRANGNPSVGVYLDDVYIARPFGVSYYGGLGDIERIEILHGPQGTLYGQNTSAGAIRLISRTPSNDFSGWVSAGIGNQSTYEARGYVTGALVPDVLTASLAYTHSRTNGDLKDSGRDGKDDQAVRLDQARAIFRFTPTDRFTATLTLDGTIYDEDYVLAPDPRFVAGARARQTYTIFYDTPHFEGAGASLKLEQKLGDHLSLRSISAWRGYKTTMATDWGTLPGQVRVYGFGQTLREGQLSQEFQLAGDFDRFNFISGVILYRETFSVDRLTWTNNNYTTLHSDSLTRSIGLFGQAGYHLTDALTLTAGLRYSDERKKMDASSYRSDITAADLTPVYVIDGLSKGFSGFTPKVSLDYRLSSNALIYVSWAKGITSGGYNPAASTRAIASVPVDTEKVTAYEAGLKVSGWNGRVQANAAIFYNDYHDYQASVSNPVINGQTVPGGVVVNAGDAHIYGAELDTSLKPAPRWDVSLSLAYLHTEFVSFLNPSGAAATDLTGQSLPKAPKFTLGLSSGYILPLGGLGKLHFTGALRHETQSFSDISADREITKYPRQTYVDAGLTHSIGHWTTSLTVKNLLNETYRLPGLYSPTRNVYDVTYNSSRTFLLSVKRAF